MDSLISQVQQLGVKADFWSSVVNWLIFATALVAVMYFGATIRQSVVAKKLRNAQESLSKAKDDQLTADLRTKDLAIAAANEEAKEAGKSAGEANKRAEEIARENIALKGQFDTATAEANRKAEELRAQNLATEGRLTEASTKLEKERIKRAELELTLAPRIIPFRRYADGTENIDSLKSLGGTEVLLEYIQDAEAGRAAANIKWLIERSGWKVVSAGVTSKSTLDGVEILSFVANGPEQANFQFRSLDTAQTLDEFLLTAHKVKVVSIRRELYTQIL
jgi:hypothetical protein